MGLCCRFWLKFARGISLLSLSDTRRPVKVWQWVSNTEEMHYKTHTCAFLYSVMKYRLFLPVDENKRVSRLCEVQDRGSSVSGLQVSRFGRLFPRPAPPCPKTSGQPHGAANFWKPYV